MAKEIGWSPKQQESYLLAQIKSLTARQSAIASRESVTSINGLSDAEQTFAVGTAGTGLTITSSEGVHTFNIPNASASTKGLLTAVDYTIFKNKQDAIEKLTNEQMIALTPTVGTIVYCVDGTEGLYIYKSTGWTFIV